MNDHNFRNPQAHAKHLELRAGALSHRARTAHRLGRLAGRANFATQTHFERTGWAYYGTTAGKPGRWEYRQTYIGTVVCQYDSERKEMEQATALLERYEALNHEAHFSPRSLRDRERLHTLARLSAKAITHHTQRTGWVALTRGRRRAWQYRETIIDA